MDTLSYLLTTFMTRAQIGSRRLSQRTGIPRTSIDNWRAGTAERPNQWQPLLIIAHTLALTQAEADALLTTAGYPSLYALAHDLPEGHPDCQYLQPWLATPASELVATPTLPLHQLRAPITDFVGRDDTITKLVTVIQAAADDGAIATISGVRGMGGVGKTELAYVIANRLVDVFPDAQIVVALRGTSDTPLPATQVLHQVIHTFTPNAKLPDDLEVLQRHYRSVLHGKRVLILADDAHDAAQARPFLPPAGCALLVTSRQRFSLPGMATIDLEQLAADEAATLLRRICPRLSYADAQALAHSCGALPLALRVSGGILHNDPSLPVATYLARLADDRYRLAQLRDPDDAQLDVEASLALSYDLLDTMDQAVFRQLGVFVADFTTEFAQAVVEVVAGVEVTDVLRRLLRRNLVQYDAIRARWRLHDLLHDLGRHELEVAGEYEATCWRYAHAAVQLAQEFHDQYLADGIGILENLARFDAERPHFDAARAWGTAHAETPDGDQLILAMALATTHFGELRSDAERERIPQLESALSAAQRLGQLHAEGQLLLSLGRATFDLGRFRHTIEVWEHALDIFQELGDQHSEGLTLGNLGTAYARLGEPLRAIPAYEQALALFRALGDRRHEAHALGNLGATYADLETAQAAIPYLEEALAYARAVRDRRFEGMLLHALGDVARALGHTRRSHLTCTDALTIAREIGDRQQEGYILITLGRAYATCGDHLRAIATFDQALTILQDVGDRWGAATCRWHYGLMLADQGNRDRALPLLRASVAYMMDIRHARAATHKALLDRLEAGEELPAVLRHPMAERMVGSDVETTEATSDH